MELAPCPCHSETLRSSQPLCVSPTKHLGILYLLLGLGLLVRSFFFFN